MPQPNYPPPSNEVGATTQPRQLQRWIDVNPQGGKLSRARYYIGLPVFSQAVSWKGVSDIVAAFNFEAPNNFSIVCDISQPPVTKPVAYNVVDIPGGGDSGSGSGIGVQGGNGGIS